MFRASTTAQSGIHVCLDQRGSAPAHRCGSNLATMRDVVPAYDEYLARDDDDPESRRPGALGPENGRTTRLELNTTAQCCRALCAVSL